MAFDWTKYLALAKEMARRPDEEAQRTAVSSAYYAAFGKARLRLREDGVVLPRQGAHEFVWNTFQNDVDPARQQIGIDGDRLKRIRRNADYGESFAALPALLQSTLVRAEKLIQSLDRL